MAPAPNLERRALKVSAGASLLVAVVGLWFAGVADSQAVLLDGLFNAIYFVMSLLSLKVAELIQRPDDERFPFGYAQFEPLINLTKGLLITGVSIMAFIGAVSALVGDGRETAAGAAIGYGIFAAVVGLGTAALQRRWARATGSPLVAVDVNNWAINGALSLVVSLAFGAIFLIRGTSFAWAEPYVDPALVALLVIVAIPVPVKMVRDALLDILGAAPERETVERVDRAVAEATAPLGARHRVVRTIRVGRKLYALVHLVFDRGEPLTIADLDDAREQVGARLAKLEPGLDVDLVFTGDERWTLPPG